MKMAKKKAKGANLIVDEIKRIQRGGKELKKEIEQEVFFNVPNTLTLTRLAFAFILVYLILFTEDYYLILILFAIAAITDYFDGFFARRLNQKTQIGARLDQVIDRVFMIPIAIMLIFKLYNINPNMAYLLIICLSREIIGTAGFIIRIIRNSDPYRVKYIGKVTTFIQSFAVGSIILTMEIPQIAIAAWILGIATSLVGILAGFDYLKDSLK